LFMLVALIVGAIRTFRRNFLMTLLLMLFLPGIWVIWALIELFIEPPATRL